MGKTINKYFPALFAVLFFLVLESCSRSKPALVTQPILLNQGPEISIKYEYDVVTINIPVIVLEDQPTAYRFSIHSRNNPSELFIERLFFPEDTKQVVLPRNIFSTDSLGNVAVLEAMGGDFEKLVQLFTLSQSPAQELETFRVRITRDILKLSIFSRAEMKPLSLVQVQVQTEAGLILNQGLTDSLGFVRIELLRAEENANPLKITIDTQGLYPIWKREILIPETGILNQNILLGSLRTLEEGVVIYKVIQDLSPLREGPENGAASKFLLAVGDKFYASKVAGDRLFGEVEVFIGDSQQSTFFQGWILKNLVELEQ